MRHTLPLAPQFYVTAPQSCPYLDGRQERKLFTSMQGVDADELNDALSHQGFRRSQNVFYRPSCADCQGCMSARIAVDRFQPSKSQRRARNRNAHLRRNVRSPWATEEQYDLFRTYLDARHATGGMADMDMFEFAAMIEETPVRTRVLEYTNPDSRALEAVCLTDVLSDGVSMVYSFFTPERPRDSIGTYLVLDHIEIAREAGLDYVYLGYWVPGSEKMGYKAAFSGLEVYRGNTWEAVENPADYSADADPLTQDPVIKQVAGLKLPE